jgi:Transposase DDE domain
VRSDGTDDDVLAAECRARSQDRRERLRPKCFASLQGHFGKSGSWYYEISRGRLSSLPAAGKSIHEGVGKRGCKSRGEDDAVGYDAGKKVKGRNLRALVDVEGLPLRVVVHSAGMRDRDGAGVVLDKIRQRFPWLELVWADSSYNSRQVKDALAKVPGCASPSQATDPSQTATLETKICGKRLSTARAANEPRRRSKRLSRPTAATASCGNVVLFCGGGNHARTRGRDSNYEPLSDAFVNFSLFEGRGGAICDGPERVVSRPSQGTSSTYFWSAGI